MTTIEELLKGVNLGVDGEPPHFGPDHLPPELMPAPYDGPRCPVCRKPVANAEDVAAWNRNMATLTAVMADQVAISRRMHSDEINLSPVCALVQNVWSMSVDLFKKST